MRFLTSLIAFFAAVSMRGEETTMYLDLHLPVVDMRDYYSIEKRDAFIDTLYHAMHEVGFFAVRNASVDQDILREAYFQAEQFFKLPSYIKEKNFIKDLNAQRGFVPGETAKGNRTKDCKEFYHIGRENSQEGEILQNLWPENPQFKKGMVNLYNELETYVSFLFEAIAEAVNRNAKHPIPSDFFSSLAKGGDSLLRALYYPALSEENVCRAAVHTDIDLLGILPLATEKGLQIEIEGQWFNVVVPEDTFIVNVGDMLENLTNGLFVSTRHRVIALEANKERFAMVFFVHPPNDTPLDPLAVCIEQTGGVQRYALGNRREFLWERLLELNIAPGLLESYAQMGHVERQALFGRESPQVVEMLIQKGLASPELLEILSFRNKEVYYKDSSAAFRYTPYSLGIDIAP